MKIKTIIYIYYVKYSWEPVGEYIAYSSQIEDSEYMTFVATNNVELDVPDKYDATAQKIAALVKEQENAFQIYSESVSKIAERIGKLQALEYKE